MLYEHITFLFFLNCNASLEALSVILQNSKTRAFISGEERSKYEGNKSNFGEQGT